MPERPARDRRDPHRQRPTLGGKRSMDFTLTSRQCANRLGVSTDFIVAEILDKKLRALIIAGRGKRSIYRISEDDWAVYTLKHVDQPKPLHPARRLNPLDKPAH